MRARAKPTPQPQVRALGASLGVLGMAVVVALRSYYDSASADARGCMEKSSVSKQVAEGLDANLNGSGSLFGSILAGLLVGYFLDRWLGTSPWLTIGATLLGIYSGSLRLWATAKEEEEKYLTERKQLGR
jgi:F0F1-type ATP synthase assembly protein I